MDVRLKTTAPHLSSVFLLISVPPPASPLLHTTHTIRHTLCVSACFHFAQSGFFKTNDRNEGPPRSLLSSPVLCSPVSLSYRSTSERSENMQTAEQTRFKSIGQPDLNKEFVFIRRRPMALRRTGWGGTTRWGRRLVTTSSDVSVVHLWSGSG